MILSKVIKSINANGLRQLIVQCFGLNDARTATQIGPFGVDSQPLKDIRVIYANTAKAGNSFIVGCVNINNLAQDGESRYYSLKDNGDLCTYIWLHNQTGEGQIEIGGTDNYAVKYNELATQFNELKGKFNSLVTLFNTHVHTGGTLPGGVTGTTTPSATSSSADITQAKNEKIKTL